MSIFGLGNSNKAVAPKQTSASQGTFLGNALEKTGKIANEHPTETKIVQCVACGFLGLSIVNNLAKRFAPEKYDAYITQPINNRVIQPLQKRGLLAKAAESQTLFTESKGWLGRYYTPVKGFSYNGTNVTKNS